MASATTASAAAPALPISDLRKVYDNGVQALKGVSLQVEPGDFSLGGYQHHAPMAAPMAV